MRLPFRLLSIMAAAGFGLMTAAFTHPQGHRFDASGLDTDHNGAISDAELAVHVDQLFAHADTDHDGTLGAPELQAFHEMMRGAMVGSSAMAHGGGEPVMTTMSQAQFRQAMVRFATSLDTDGDHILSVNELNTAFATGSAH